MIQTCFNNRKLFISHLVEISKFGNVLTNQSIGMLIESSLPRVIGPSERTWCIEYRCNFFMIRKFFSIIKSHRMDYQTFHHLIKSFYNSSRIFLTEIFKQNEFWMTINTTQDHTLILGSNDCIGFAIANAYFLFNNFRTLWNINLSWNAPSAYFLPIQSFLVTFSTVS